MTHRSRRFALAVAALVVALALAGGCEKKEKGPNYGDNLVTAMDKGKVMGARGDLQTLAIAITNYILAEGNPPSARDIDELAGQLQPSHVRRAPKVDPWGTPYDYQGTGDGYTLRSAGHDQQFFTTDDVIMEDGAITQLPEGYKRFQ